MLVVCLHMHREGRLSLEKADTITQLRVKTTLTSQ